jgi:hypothetical protein
MRGIEADKTRECVRMLVATHNSVRRTPTETHTVHHKGSHYVVSQSEAADMRAAAALGDDICKRLAEKHRNQKFAENTRRDDSPRADDREFRTMNERVVPANASDRTKAMIDNMNDVASRNRAQHCARGMVPTPIGLYMNNRRLRAIQARGGGIVVVAPGARRRRAKSTSGCRSGGGSDDHGTSRQAYSYRHLYVHVRVAGVVPEAVGCSRADYAHAGSRDSKVHREFQHRKAGTAAAHFHSERVRIRDPVG